MDDNTSNTSNPNDQSGNMGVQQQKSKTSKAKYGGLGIIVIIIVVGAVFEIWTGYGFKSSTTTNNIVGTNQSTNQSINVSKSVQQSYIYCLGGWFFIPANYTYYSKITANGLSWSSTTPYPMQLAGTQCTTDNGYIYCVGGTDLNASIKISKVNLSYYAPISQSGIGAWKSTTPYPIPFYGSGCYANNGYIYCVGDGYIPTNNVTQGAVYGKMAYYAPISPSGIGVWKSTTPIPIKFMNSPCNIYDGYIYCTMNQTFYAPISSSGIGAWNESAVFPGATAYAGYDANGCGVYNGIIACLTFHYGEIVPNMTEVFYANISPNGSIGAWSKAPQYPGSFESGINCGSTSNGYLYCIGSGSKPYNATYYASISSSGISAWQTSQNYPSATLGSCTSA
ncbi:MAG: hypothetical protein M1504_03505 [Candidatus Marsarchaeota archaeon]|nr:hypothetical protein [Candidatus Marsarchaeota archaeon]